MPTKKKKKKASPVISKRQMEKMKPSERRVVIIRDVLAKLDLKRLIATPGMWLDARPEVDEKAKPFITPRKLKRHKNKELTEILPEHCYGCAMGAIFLSTIDRFDDCKVRDMFDEQSVLDNHDDESSDNSNYGFDFRALKGKLTQFFEESQLQLIEIAFEWDTIDDHPRGSTDIRQASPEECHATITFSAIVDATRNTGLERFERRMRAIMWNIIENRGTFRPEKGLQVSLKKRMKSAS